MDIKNQWSASGDYKEEENLSHEVRELFTSLPKEKGWRTRHLYLFQNFWCPPKEIQSILSLQSHYKAQDSDLILVTYPKSGTKWLKALAYAIVNRNQFGFQKNHPLLTSNPHDLVPFFEYKLYANGQLPYLSALPSPRLLAAHMPYQALPESVKKSGCRIVYLVRNPFDTFVSQWHYVVKIRPESLGPFPLEDAFDMYCRGVTAYGPYWDHMLGYWNESKESPHKVMFLKYEEMKEHIILNLKRLAEFMGFPFSVEEEKNGVIKEIERLCSFENMKDLEVNKKGKSIAHFDNKHLFRKGEVGDWVNYFSMEMVEQLSQVMEEMLAGSGLSFKLSNEENESVCMNE